MIKIVTLLAVGLVLGCSSSAKKETKESSAPSSTAATSAPVAAATAMADAKGTAANVKLEGSAKKEKKSKVNKEEKAAAVSGKGDLTCVSGKDSRSLSIKAKGKGCELEYTKAGQTSAVASQTIGQEKCDEVSTKIQANLTTSGFKCE